MTKAKSAVCRCTTEGYLSYFPEHYRAKQKQDPCSSCKADQNYKSGNEMLIYDFTYLPLDCYRNCYWILAVKPEWQHKNENSRHLRSLITHDTDDVLLPSFGQCHVNSIEFLLSFLIAYLQTPPPPLMKNRFFLRGGGVCSQASFVKASSRRNRLWRREMSSVF